MHIDDDTGVITFTEAEIVSLEVVNQLGEQIKKYVDGVVITDPDIMGTGFLVLNEYLAILVGALKGQDAFSRVVYMEEHPVLMVGRKGVPELGLVRSDDGNGCAMRELV